MSIDGLRAVGNSIIQKFSNPRNITALEVGVATVAALGLYLAPWTTTLLATGAFVAVTGYRSWSHAKETSTIRRVEQATGLDRDPKPEMNEQANVLKTALRAMDPIQRATFEKQVNLIAQGLMNDERIKLSLLLLNVKEGRQEFVNLFASIRFRPEQKIEGFEILREVTSSINKTDLMNTMMPIPDFLKLISLQHLNGIKADPQWQNTFQTWISAFVPIAQKLVDNRMPLNQQQEISRLLYQMPEEERLPFLIIVNDICPQGDPLRGQVIQAIHNSKRDVSKINQDIKDLAKVIGIKDLDTQKKLDLIDILEGIKETGKILKEEANSLLSSGMPVETKIKLFKLLVHMPSSHRNAALSILPINATAEGKETILKIVNQIPAEQLYIVRIAKDRLIQLTMHSAERAKILELLLSKTDSEKTADSLCMALKKLTDTIEKKEVRLTVLDQLIEAEIKDTSIVELIDWIVELPQGIDDSNISDILQVIIGLKGEPLDALKNSVQALLPLFKKSDRASILKSLLSLSPKLLRDLYLERIQNHIEKNGMQDLLNTAGVVLEQIKLLANFITPSMEWYEIAVIITNFQGIGVDEDPKDVLNQALRLGDTVPADLKSRYFTIIAKINKDEREGFVENLIKINSNINNDDKHGLFKSLLGAEPNERIGLVNETQTFLKNQLEKLSKEFSSEKEKKEIAELFRQISYNYKERFVNQALDLISIFDQSFEEKLRSLQILKDIHPEKRAEFINKIKQIEDKSKLRSIITDVSPDEIIDYLNELNSFTNLIMNLFKNRDDKIQAEGIINRNRFEERASFSKQAFFFINEMDEKERLDWLSIFQSVPASKRNAFIDYVNSFDNKSTLLTYLKALQSNQIDDRINQNRLFDSIDESVINDAKMIIQSKQNPNDRADLVEQALLLNIPNRHRFFYLKFLALYIPHGKRADFVAQVKGIENKDHLTHDLCALSDENARNYIIDEERYKWGSSLLLWFKSDEIKTELRKFVRSLTPPEYVEFIDQAKALHLPANGTESEKMDWLILLRKIPKNERSAFVMNANALLNRLPHDLKEPLNQWIHRATLDPAFRQTLFQYNFQQASKFELLEFLNRFLPEAFPEPSAPPPQILPEFQTFPPLFSPEPRRPLEEGEKPAVPVDIEYFEWNPPAPSEKKEVLHAQAPSTRPTNNASVIPSAPNRLLTRKLIGPSTTSNPSPSSYPLPIAPRRRWGHIDRMLNDDSSAPPPPARAPILPPRDISYDDE